jgi:hypothetical protein
MNGALCLEAYERKATRRREANPKDAEQLRRDRSASVLGENKMREQGKKARGEKKSSNRKKYCTSRLTRQGLLGTLVESLP